VSRVDVLPAWTRSLNQRRVAAVYFRRKNRYAGSVTRDTTLVGAGPFGLAMAPRLFA